MIRFRTSAPIMMLIVFGAGLSLAGLMAPANAAAPDRTARVERAARGPTTVLTAFVYLPIVTYDDPCQTSTGETYGSLAIPNWVSGTLPAENHPDINLAVRGYTPTTANLGLVDYGPPTDLNSPQLAGLFSTPHAPTFVAVYQVYNWNWPCCQGGPIDDPAVTFAELSAVPGDLVRTPDRSNGDIGMGYRALVLYASANRVTLKFTSEDDMISGYGLHIENICVDKDLLALYQTLNTQGRHSLPALQAGQAIGHVPDFRFGVAVRDTGAFMDPRSVNDWWRGYMLLRK